MSATQLVKRPNRLFTVQQPGRMSPVSQLTQATSHMLSWTVSGTLTKAPRWWSKTRDDWLATFPKWDGNDLLAGAVSTLIAKIASANFFIEGPKDLAQTYMNILLQQSEFGSGWSPFISKWVQSYLCRDGGGLAERLRASAGDRTGPASGFSHLDESKCLYTDDPEFPVAYVRPDGRMVKMHRSQVMRITDMPSSAEEDLGVGFCGVSRAIATAHILMDLVKYRRERLSDLPPAGILFINNMTEAQWQDIIVKYDARQRNQGNTVWKDILVAIGLDPEYQIGAEMFELSKLWDSYDESQFTQIAIFTFALAFRVDPREYWPVSAGQLGTATEAQIQHLKAKAKGEGIIFSEVERQLNSPFSLPPELTFRFDYRDVDEDLRQAEVEKAQIENIRKLWESSPNRQALVSPPQGNTPGGDRPVPPGAVGDGRDQQPQGRQQQRFWRAQDPNQTPEDMSPDNMGDRPRQDPQLNEGMISTEEARILLVRKGLIPAEFLMGAQPDRERLYAVRNWGPRVRVHRDGYVEKIV